MKLKYINENISRMIPPIETFNRVKDILLSQELLADYGHLEGNKTIKLLFPNFYALGTEKTHRYVKKIPFTAYGKGFTIDCALASCLMEFSERYSTFKAFKTKVIKTSSIEDMSSKIFYNFERCLKEEKRKILADITTEELHSYKFRWHEFVNFKTDEVILAPMYYWGQICGSNGIATGNSFQEAMLHGIYEVIERHCMTIFLRNKENCPEIKEDLYNKYEDVKKALHLLSSIGCSYKILDISYEFDLPVIAFLCNFPNGKSSITFGVSGRLSEAIIRTITECSQLSDHSHLFFPTAYFNFCKGKNICEGIKETFDEDINIELETVKALLKDHDIYYFDCTDEDLKIPTVGIYIDGLLFDDNSNGRTGSQHLDNMYSIRNAMKKEGVF